MLEFIVGFYQFGLWELINYVEVMMKLCFHFENFHPFNIHIYTYIFFWNKNVTEYFAGEFWKRNMWSHIENIKRTETKYISEM